METIMWSVIIIGFIVIRVFVIGVPVESSSSDSNKNKKDDDDKPPRLPACIG